MYVTRLFLNEKLEEILEACEYCTRKDETFKYRLTTNRKHLLIFNQNRDQAYKRGMYFHKKYGVHFNVEKWKCQENVSLTQK